MKVRNGFVSNSSTTTSFVVVGIPIPDGVLWKTKKTRGCPRTRRPMAGFQLQDMGGSRTSLI